MDPITTGLGGAVLGRALPREKAGPVATLVVTVASVVPDADIFFDTFVDDALFGLTTHRGFTHSFVGAAILAPLLALLFWRFTRDKNYLRLLALCGLGLLWHIWTDVNTSWGTMVYFPFNRTRVVWDLVFIVDFIFTAILLFPHLEAFIYRERPGALRRGGLLLALLAGVTAGLVGLGGAARLGLPPVLVGVRPHRAGGAGRLHGHLHRRPPRGTGARGEVRRREGLDGGGTGGAAAAPLALPLDGPGADP